MKEWYCPKPWRVAEAGLDIRPGGRFNTVFAGPNGERHDNNGAFLDVIPMKRLVFTDAYSEDYLPSEKHFMTGYVDLSDTPEGKTRMVWGARHGNEEDQKTHLDMGFAEGWQSAARQLEELAGALPRNGVAGLQKKLRTCLWFEKGGLEAAEFYVSLLPNSFIEATFQNGAPVGGASSAAAQRIGVAGICLGASCLTLGAGMVAAPEALDDLEVSLELEGVEGERRTYEALSLGLGSSASTGRASAPEVRNAFGQCAETLAERRPNTRPVVEQATASLIRDGLGKADAEDLAMQTLLRVCLQHARAPTEDLIAYYWGALRNNSRTFWRRGYRAPIEYEDELFSYEQDLPADARLALKQELASFRAALDELTAKDREVLELHYVDGLSYAAIAERRRESEDAVRQRARRARARLERAWRQQVGLH